MARVTSGSLCCLLLFSILININLSKASDLASPQTYGTEFVFAVIPNFVNNIGVIIEPVTQTETTVQLSCPLLNFTVIVTLPAGSAPYNRVLLTDSDIVSSASDLIDTTVRITATSEISVVAYNAYAYSMDTFVVLPTAHLGQEYFIASYSQPQDQCGIIEVSALENPTEVQITLSAALRFRGVYYTKGETLVQELSPWQTMQISAPSTDVTGSRVWSNNSVSTVVGCVCANIQSVTCDMAVEQLIPFDRWGKSFILSPFPGGSDGFVFQILAGRDNTRVTIDHRSFVLNAGEHIVDETRSINIKAVRATKPISVMQYCKGAPSMVIVPPEEQFVDQLEFAVDHFTHTDRLDAVYVGVTANCNSMNDISFNELRNDEVPWIFNSSLVRFDGLHMCTSWLDVADGRHRLMTSNPDGRFTVVVYGSSYSKSFLHNPAYQMKILTDEAGHHGNVESESQEM